MPVRYYLRTQNGSFKTGTYGGSKYMAEGHKRASQASKQQNGPIIWNNRKSGSSKRKQLGTRNKKNKKHKKMKYKLAHNKNQKRMTSSNSLRKNEEVVKQNPKINKKGNKKKINKNSSTNSRKRSKQRQKKGKKKNKNAKKKYNKNIKRKANEKGKRKTKIRRNGNKKQINKKRNFTKNKKKSNKHANRKKNRTKNKNKKQKKNKKSKSHGKFKKGRKKKKNKKSKRPIRKNQLNENDYLDLEAEDFPTLRDDDVYPILDSRNVSGTFRVIRIHYGSQPGGTKKEVLLRRYDNGFISIIDIESRKDNVTRKSFITKTTQRYVYVCYDIYRRCFANWNDNCLNTEYDGTVLKILEAKRSTRDGIACDYWNDTIWNTYHNTVENRCVFDLKTLNGIYNVERYPYCMATYVQTPCFIKCNPDLATTVVNNMTKRLYLMQRSGKHMVIKSNGEKVNICGRDRMGNIVNITVLRCYDKTKHCIANANGTCLYEFLDDFVVKVLSNANVTITGKQCLTWNTTQYRKYVQNPNANICDMPYNNIRNEDGPWCTTEYGIGGHCFHVCDRLRPVDTNLSIWDNPENWISYDSDPPYPLLDYNNRIIRLKLKSTIRHRSIYAILKWYSDGNIMIAQFAINKNRYNSNSFVDSADEKEIKRCFNPLKNCVAEWNGVCLNESFSGITLEILLSNAYSARGSRCFKWASLQLPKFENIEGNRCMNDTDRAISDGPFCVTRLRKSSCFRLCQIDVAKQILGPSKPVVVLPQLRNKKITLKWINETQISIVGNAKYYGTIKFQETIHTCYDKKVNCLSVVHGACIKTRYPPDVVTILSNHVHTHSGKPCMDWSTTHHFTYGMENAPLNLCSQLKTDQPPEGVFGPWCFTKEDGDLGAESCFEDCALLETKLKCAQYQNVDFCEFGKQLDEEHFTKLGIEAMQQGCNFTVSQRNCITLISIFGNKKRI